MIELLPHQQKAIDEMHNGCILVGDMGVGKTFTALVYFYTKVCGGVVGDLMGFRHPRDVYVITTAKVRDELDWEESAAKLGISTDPSLSVDGVKLTVDSWNNIGKYMGVKDAFFVFDEQRLVGSGTWTKAFIEIAKRNQWVLLSATPGDNWLDYIPVFLANGFYKNRTEFKRLHVQYSAFTKYPKVERYHNVGRLVRQRNQILVKMPLMRHTTRHITDIPVEYDEALYEKVTKKRWHVFEERPLRDVAEMFIVARRVVNSSESRVIAVQSLLTTHPKLIVFYNHNHELEKLRELGNQICLESQKAGVDTFSFGSALSPTGEPTAKKSSSFPLSSSSPTMRLSTSEGTSKRETSFAVAEWNGHKHQPIPKTDSWLYLVQYTAGSEGWNCVETDAMCFYSLTYSYKQFYQAFGRIDRINTPFKDLFYYILMDTSGISRGVRAALNQKKNFNEKAFKM